MRYVSTAIADAALFADAFSDPAALWRVRHDALRQAVRLGVDAAPVVALGAAFTGAVTTVQSVYMMTNPLIPRSTVGMVVAPSLVLELAAVVTAFLLTGRLTARVASEVAAMRAGEQLDALEAMGASAPATVVAPRVLAGVLAFPALYALAAAVGVASAAVAGDASGFLSAEEFLLGARQTFDPFHPLFGLMKGVMFGFVLAAVGCAVGYRAGRSAAAVGEAATSASVAAAVLVLALDWALAALLL